jgi:tetratricopeptide (TPR) repeat protein
MKGAYYFFKKGKLLSKKGKLLDAIMILEKAKDLEPKKGSIREVLACAYYNCGLYHSAGKNFIKALEIDATNDFAHYGLGMCLIKENKINQAAGHLKMASVMKPCSKKYKEILKRIT